MRKYRGSAGAKPEARGGGFKTRGLRLFEDAKNDEGEKIQKKIVDFKLEAGEKKRPVVILDNDLDFAVRMHKGFKHDGTWANMVVCRSALDDTRGCPLCDVLERRFSWYLVGTLIDMGTWSPDKGKNAGKVYRNFRRLLLIPDSVAETFEAQGEELETWRGSRFKVSRSTKDKSLRIGDSWVYDHKGGCMSEQELMDEFEEQAGTYICSAEAYCAPYDYDKILAPLPYERLLEIAEDLDSGAGAASTTRKSLAHSGTSTDGEVEDLPF